MVKLSEANAMNQPQHKLTAVSLAPIRKLPKGVAIHRSFVGKLGRVVWAWKPLSSAQRIQVKHATRATYLNVEHLDRVLEAKNLQSNARRRAK